MSLSRRLLALALGSALAASGCASALEVPIETPLKSKLDVSKFRRVLVAGFVTDLVDEGIDLAPETARLLQNQLRSASKLQVIEPDRPPLNQTLARTFKVAEDVRVTREDRDRYRAESPVFSKSVTAKAPLAVNRYKSPRLSCQHFCL